MVERKKIDKRMEAETVVQLKHMLEIELKRIQEANDIDIIMFVGIDGRIFSSIIPPMLNATQFRFLNMVKTNLTYICQQLKGENLKVSIQQYEFGTIIISGVGDNCFLASVLTKDLKIDSMGPVVSRIINGSIVMNHLFELRPITPEELEGYDEEVAKELSKLTRLLFVEKFEDTREYKRNMDLLDFLKKKISSVVGIGAVDEVITLTMNEMGKSPAYMKDKDWLKFVSLVIDNQIKERSGDIVAEECKTTWIPEVERKLKSFV